MKKDKPSRHLNDKLLSLLGDDSKDVLGIMILVYTKGGDGPEGILCHTFDNGLERVPNLPEMLERLAKEYRDRGWRY